MIAVSSVWGLAGHDGHAWTPQRPQHSDEVVDDVALHSLINQYHSLHEVNNFGLSLFMGIKCPSLTSSPVRFIFVIGVTIFGCLTISPHTRRWFWI